MVQHSAGRSNKNFDSLFELSSLVFNWDSAVDRERRKLVGVVLEVCDNVCTLDRELTGRCEDDSLNLTCAEQFIFP